MLRQSRLGLSTLLVASALALSAATALAQTHAQTSSASQKATSRCDAVRKPENLRVVQIQVTSGSAKVFVDQCAIAIIDNQLIESGPALFGDQYKVSHVALLATYGGSAVLSFEGSGTVTYLSPTPKLDENLGNGDGPHQVQFSGAGDISIYFNSDNVANPLGDDADELTDLPHNWLYLGGSGKFVVSNWTRIVAGEKSDVEAHNVFRIHAVDDATVTADDCWEGAAGAGASIKGSCVHMNNLDGRGVVQKVAPPQFRRVN